MVKISKKLEVDTNTALLTVILIVAVSFIAIAYSPLGEQHCECILHDPEDYGALQ